MKCPKCKRIIIDTDENGVSRLRTRILLFQADGTVAVCPECKTRMKVPVRLEDGREPVQQHVIML